MTSGPPPASVDTPGGTRRQGWDGELERLRRDVKRLEKERDI
jgi:hypothetical protein